MISPSTKQKLESMKSTVPTGCYQGAEVVRFTVPVPGMQTFEEFVAGLSCELDGRPVLPGHYTKLVVDGTLWMSDTPAELIDHFAVLSAIEYLSAKRVLINGLGLGCIVQGALAIPTVEHIDVVESDQRIMSLVGKHFQSDQRVLLHSGDAFEVARGWSAGTRWDVAWHDIWSEISADNLKDMQRLHRSYGKRVRWQGSWCRRECEERRQEEQRWSRAVAAQLARQR